MKLAERTAEIQAEIGALQVELAQAERDAVEELRRVAGDSVLHLISEAEGVKRRSAIERDLTKRRERLRVLEESLPEIERRRRVEQERNRQNALNAARRKLANAASARDSAVKNLVRAIRSLDAAMAEVKRHRPHVEEAVAKEHDLLVRGEEGTPVADESWEPPAELIEFLTEGPVAPIAKRETALAEGEAARAQRDRELLDWYAVRPTTALLRELPERLRQEGRAILAEHEEKAAEQLRKREERDAKQGFKRLGEQRSRPPAPISG